MPISSRKQECAIGYFLRCSPTLQYSGKTQAMGLVRNIFATTRVVHNGSLTFLSAHQMMRNILQLSMALLHANLCVWHYRGNACSSKISATTSPLAHLGEACKRRLQSFTLREQCWRGKGTQLSWSGIHKGRRLQHKAVESLLCNPKSYASEVPSQPTCLWPLLQRSCGCK